MKKNPVFKFTITKLSENEIRVDAYNHVDTDLYRKSHIMLALNTIPSLIAVLGNKKMIFEEEKLPAINNNIDTIEFEYKGSDRAPLLSVLVDHKLEKGGIDEGIMSIPLDFMGREEENMEYIMPLLAELQKYVP